MPSAVCDGPAWSVCNRETERGSGDSGLDKDNVCILRYGIETLEFQVSWGAKANICQRRGEEAISLESRDVLRHFA